MIDSLQQFVATTDPLWQWLAVAVAGMIPFIESYFGSTLGIAAGVPAVIAIVAAIVGNWISMIVFVTFGQQLRALRGASQSELSPRREKLKKTYEKYGVPGVSILGQTILPSQISSMAMVTFGARKSVVILWQTISIILWGVIFGLFATYGLSIL